jgi:hypothetical protein
VARAEHDNAEAEAAEARAGALLECWHTKRPGSRRLTICSNPTDAVTQTGSGLTIYGDTMQGGDSDMGALDGHCYRYRRRPTQTMVCIQFFNKIQGNPDPTRLLEYPEPRPVYSSDYMTDGTFSALGGGRAKALDTGPSVTTQPRLFARAFPCVPYKLQRLLCGHCTASN